MDAPKASCSNSRVTTHTPEREAPVAETVVPEPEAPRRTARRRPSVPMMLLVAAVFVLFVWPVLMIFVGTFRGTPPGQPAVWGFDPLLNVYRDAQTYHTLGNSIGMALAVTLLAKSTGLYFAWVVARTDARLRRIVSPMMFVVLATPPLFFAIAWATLGNDPVGPLNIGGEKLFGGAWPGFNIESWPGLIFVAALKSVPAGYFLTLGPFLAFNRAAEEAAFVSGASRLAVFFRVHVPMLAPAYIGALILGFVITLEYFDIPLVLGIPADIRVFSTRVYEYMNNYTVPRYAEASALSLLVLLVLLVLLFVQARMTGGKQYVTVTGKSQSTAPWRMGGWRWVIDATIVLYLLLALVAPMAQLVFSSFQPFFGVYDLETFSRWNYEALFESPETMTAIRTTLILTLAGGFAATAIALVIAYSAKRSNRWTRRYLTFATWLPWTVPGPTLALGLLWAYMSLEPLAGLYGSLTLLMLGIIVAVSPIAMRAVDPALAQLAPELEEAAWVSGASRTRTLLVVVARLVAPSFISGWVLAGVVASGNLAIPLLLASVENRPVSVLTFQLYSSGNGPQAAALFTVVTALILIPALLVKLIQVACTHATKRLARTS